MSLADACSRIPFSNGTEVEAWLNTWCDYCALNDESYGCDLTLHAFVPDETPWPEAWLPEPDDGHFFLPSRLVCLAFQPGPDGDPGATERAERIAEVKAYWAPNGSSVRGEG